MALTAAASWLNTAFAGYDRLILSALHAVSNGFFTFLFKLITLIGEKGLVFFLAALIMMCFPKTRKLGVCIFGAVCCGALITNIILKDAIARPRPLTVVPYSQWWAEIGAPAEDGWSFPSGHVTAAAAGMVAIRLMKGKKWMVPAVVWVVLMMIARNYLMAHYPSDVLAAAIIGTASAFISYYITRFIFQFLYINRKKNWCGLVLNWSAPDWKGIPSRLGLTGEPVNDYFSKTFGDDNAPADAAGKSRNRSAGKFAETLKAAGAKTAAFSSSLVKKIPSRGKAPETAAEEAQQAAVAEDGVETAVSQAEETLAAAAESQPAPEAAVPDAEEAPAPAEEKPDPTPTAGSHTAAEPKKSRFSLTGTKKPSSSRSGYQGKHVK